MGVEAWDEHQALQASLAGLACLAGQAFLADLALHPQVAFSLQETAACQLLVVFADS